MGEGPLHGEEATPGARPYTEDHISADIALAFAGYVHATGDIDYARRVAWPVLRSVAEWIELRVSETARGYEIRDTVGPREHYERVHNNAYTNMAAAQALRGAVSCARLIGVAPEPAWERIADGLALPGSPRRRAIINHDGARLDEPQGGVPEGATGLFPIGYPVPESVAAATYRYAATKQGPLYVGSPMMSALLPTFAARAGESALARELLESGFGDFINTPFLEPDEYPRSRADRPQASPMFANLSAFVNTLLFGFTGIQVGQEEPSAWARHRVQLPDGWRGLHVDRVSARQIPDARRTVWGSACKPGASRDRCAAALREGCVSPRERSCRTAARSTSDCSAGAPLVRLPPTGYAGTERIVAALALELHARGHAVTVFTTGDSELPCEVVPVVPRALWGAGCVATPQPTCRWLWLGRGPRRIGSMSFILTWSMQGSSWLGTAERPSSRRCTGASMSADWFSTSTSWPRSRLSPSARASDDGILTPTG